MQNLIPRLACLACLLCPGFSVVHAEAPAAIIVDTDFMMPPADDALALMLALQSPEVEILGVTTVAGNDSVEQATADALRMLEIAGRPDVGVYRGADMPLVHAKSEFAVRSYGRWYSDEPPIAPPGGFAREPAKAESAVSFLVRSVLARPGEITVVALGPLTNIARAIRDEPRFAGHVKRLVIMGGAIALLPGGAGNLTPNAEFNFWVDPEAAHVTLRSGIPVELSPLNVSRQSALTKPWFEKMTRGDTPFTQVLEAAFAPGFAEDPDRTWLMFDPIAMASVIRPELVKTERLYVDVDIAHGISYGVSVGGREPWPGAEQAREIDVQTELDWPAFITLFSERMQRPQSPAAGRDAGP